MLITQSAQSPNQGQAREKKSHAQRLVEGLGVEFPKGLVLEAPLKQPLSSS
jgi:hypothetical protein